jgi:hypothetical protein
MKRELKTYKIHTRAGSIMFKARSLAEATFIARKFGYTGVLVIE